MSLANAASALFAATASLNGETVTITRASNSSSASLIAVPSRPELASDDMSVGRIEAEGLDWTVLACEYVLGSSTGQPAEGDQIARLNGQVYQLYNPPYRFSDSAGVRLRLHSKRIV